MRVIENGVQFAVSLDSAISDKKEAMAQSQDDFSVEQLLRFDADYSQRRAAHFKELKQLHSVLAKS